MTALLFSVMASRCDSIAIVGLFENLLFIYSSVRPPKKSWKNISNLSGGEKTLSSLALVREFLCTLITYPALLKSVYFLSNYI